MITYFVVTEPRLVVMLTWVVNSLLYTDFLVVGRLGETSWFYSLFETNLFLVGGLVMMLTRIVNCLFDINLLLVVWLETRTVLALSKIKLCLV